MINLIPNQEKKKKVKDFYFRLVVIFLAALGFCVVLGIASILPSYFLSVTEKNLTSAKLSAQKNEPETLADQNLSQAVEDLNMKLRLVEEAEKNKYPVSQKVINEIALRKMPDIKISRIVYENDAEGNRKVNVSGVAPSRERLLLFRQILEDNVAFQKVELPISNFVKGSNIEFNLSLIPS